MFFQSPAVHYTYKPHTYHYHVYTHPYTLTVFDTLGGDWEQKAAREPTPSKQVHSS